MKREVFGSLLLIVIFSYQSFGQKDNENRLEKMEKFNINQFKNTELRLNETYREVTNDSIIEYGVQDKFFFKKTFVKDSPYYSEKAYYKSNQQLRSEAYYFYSIPIGVWKKF